MDGGFERFCQFLQSACGIVVGAEQRYLVRVRLDALLRENGINSLYDLVEQLERSPFGCLRTQVLEAMCTHETLWFRDVHPFETLRDYLLPERLAANRHTPLRIWSTAASSGQEPYSIAMLLDEFEQSHSQLFRSSMDVIATELSTRMLTICQRGEYDALAIRRGLSNSRLQRYFEVIEKGRWRIKPAIRQRVTFRALNLLDSYTMLGKFDIVFCRNVLIYFNSDVREDIIKRIHASLKPGGYLLLGATEALGGLSRHYCTTRYNQSIVYQAR